LYKEAPGNRPGPRGRLRGSIREYAERGRTGMVADRGCISTVDGGTRFAVRTRVDHINTLSQNFKSSINFLIFKNT